MSEKEGLGGREKKGLIGRNVDVGESSRGVDEELEVWMRGWRGG